jgi:isocitrate lyase
MGYAFQFITLAGFHSLNLSMYELACAYRDEAMTAYARLQDREFELQNGGDGYTAVKHQSFVGTGYFDEIARTVADGQISTAALTDSTEEHQF